MSNKVFTIVYIVVVGVGGRRHHILMDPCASEIFQGLALTCSAKGLNLAEWASAKRL